MTSLDVAVLDYATATEVRRRIVSKDISPVELTKRALAKAEATQTTLNAFFVLLPEHALTAAKAAEDAVMQGRPLGPLHGIPFSAKDLMAVAGVPYASGSRAMAKNVAAVDAPAVERAQAFERRNNRPRIRRNAPDEHPTRPAEDLSLSSPME